MRIDRKMFSRLFLFVTLSLVSSSMFAQNNPDYTSIDQTTSPAPTAASLGQYGEYALDDYTGVPKINISIYDIQLKGFNLPISLSYNATGVKLEDMASWVGLGWSLNSGGVVTRSVSDVPDDYTAGEENGKATGIGILYHNWYLPGSDIPWQNDPYQFDPGSTNDTSLSRALLLLRMGSIDTEPDKFYYNFNGRSGGFVFDTGTFIVNGSQLIIPNKIRLIPYQDIKINFTTPTGGGQLTQFTITDEHGNRYIFASPENTQTSDQGTTWLDEYGSNDASESYEGGIDCYSSWYLTQIITANLDTVNYTYATESYAYTTTENLAARMMTIPFTLTAAQGNAQTYNGANAVYDGTVNWITGQRLTSISGPNFQINFTANQNRQDIINSYALTNIQVYTKVNNALVLDKQYSLSYNYEGNLSVPMISTWPQYEDTRKRLMLDTLYSLDQNGNIVNFYNFQYNNTIPLPDRESQYKDFWGYFCNNGAASDVPMVYAYPDAYTPDYQNYVTLPYSVFQNPAITTGHSYVMPGANRNTDPVGILSGTLNKIVYPTGGYTGFTFEPHAFIYNGVAITGGGLRLKQYVSYDGINHANDIVKNYSYVNPYDTSASSGVLFNLPVFAYGENTNTYTGATDDTPYLKVNLVRADVSQASLSGFDGVNVGYRVITESQPGLGKMERFYSVPGAFGILSDYTNDGACSIAQSGFCDGYFNAPIPQYVPYYDNSGSAPNDVEALPWDLGGTQANTPYSYPFAPCTNYDWNRGQILQEMVYNNNNVLLKQTNYKYTLFTPGNQGVVYVNGLRKARMTNYLMGEAGLSSPYVNGSNPMYDAIEKYQYLANLAKVPLTKTEYDYDMNNPTSYVSDSVIYTYAYNCMQPSAETHFESDGSVTTRYTKYIADIDTSQTTSNTVMEGYYTMKRNNMIDDVVESYTQVSRSGSTTTASGNLITYEPTIPKPSMSYEIQSPVPLANFSPSTTTYNSFVMDSRYQPLISFDQYDAKEDVLQQHKMYDANHSDIWDYDNSYPVAEVVNAAQSDIAYTSFEADGSGNWTIPDTTRNRTAAALSGNISFNLNSTNTITKSGLNAGTTYIVSYWSQNGALSVSSGTAGQAGITLGSWTYYEHQINGTTSVSVSGTALIDELRLYPKGALMSTYTYMPQVGMTTECGASNRLTYYTYDTFARLHLVKDQYGNILKRYDYEYQSTNQ
jgi:hypothetical protein